MAFFYVNISVETTDPKSLAELFFNLFEKQFIVNQDGEFQIELEGAYLILKKVKRVKSFQTFKLQMNAEISLENLHQQLEFYFYRIHSPVEIKRDQLKLIFQISDGHQFEIQSNITLNKVFDSNTITRFN